MTQQREIFVESDAYERFMGRWSRRLAPFLVKFASVDGRDLVIAAALCLVASLLRRRRLAIWSATPLMFEDEFPDEPLQLRL